MSPVSFFSFGWLALSLQFFWILIIVVIVTSTKPYHASICIRILFSSSFVLLTRRMYYVGVQNRRHHHHLRKNGTRITHVSLTRSTTPGQWCLFSQFRTVVRRRQRRRRWRRLTKPQAFFNVPFPFAHTNLLFCRCFCRLLFVFMFKHHSSHRNRV